jgi:hypothetical protein
MSKKLLEGLGNWFDHIKMFPKFIELGYPKEKFLYDNDVEKLSINYANRIKRNLVRFGIYNSIVIDQFIGKYFSAKADISSGNDYSESLEILNQADNKLSGMLLKTWNLWLKLDILVNDAYSLQDYEVVGYFYEELSNWTANKKII